jgi:3',5'-cyclic AMP phosphodiesterase CpdA
VALNDTHFQGPRCAEWFERVGASIRSHPEGPEFCLVLGDLSEHGTRAELGAMREALGGFGRPYYAVIGNHDYTADTDRSAWEALYPGRLNYHFAHRGWRFIGLDSTQGRAYAGTRVQPATLGWLEAQLPKLDPAEPTVVFTHFPFGENVPSRPLNADALLARFERFNLVAVFDGHYHGFTERRAGRAVLTTNRCCAISRENHDGSKEKGYFLCMVREGQIHREFIEVKPA